MARDFRRHTARTADDRRHLQDENGEVFRQKRGIITRKRGVFEWTSATFRPTCTVCRGIRTRLRPRFNAW